MSYEIRPSTDDELEAHGRLREQGYGFPPPYGAWVVDDIRAAGLTQRVLGAYDRGRLVATLTMYPFGQFFGGRPVPMGGIGGVVVAPEARGQGIAAAMLVESLRSMAQRAEVISALGPATIGVYRRAGWELAGDRCWHKISTSALSALEPTVATERRAVAGDHDALKRLYLRAASTQPGMLARPASVWAARLETRHDRYCYVATRDNTIVGYVIYTQTRGRAGYTLTVDDLAAYDWDARRCLWRHLGAHRAQARDVVTVGHVHDALALHLGEDSIAVVHHHQWMLRIIDAPAAIAARGYPALAPMTVPIRIDDPLVSANHGSWLLSAEAGKAVLDAGGAGTVAMTINGLASLYSGLVSARSLTEVGLVSGATPAQLDALDALFGGPRPTMNDDF